MLNKSPVRVGAHKKLPQPHNNQRVASVAAAAIASLTGQGPVAKPRPHMVKADRAR